MRRALGQLTVSMGVRVAVRDTALRIIGFQESLRRMGRSGIEGRLPVGGPLVVHGGLDLASVRAESTGNVLPEWLEQARVEAAVEAQAELHWQIGRRSGRSGRHRQRRQRRDR